MTFWHTEDSPSPVMCRETLFRRNERLFCRFSAKQMLFINTNQYTIIIIHSKHYIINMHVRLNQCSPSCVFALCCV